LITNFELVDRHPTVDHSVIAAPTPKNIGTLQTGADQGYFLMGANCL